MAFGSESGPGACAVFILVLNTWLLWDQMNKWLDEAGSYRWLLLLTGIVASVAFLTLLAFVVAWPWLKAQRRVATKPEERISVNLEQDALPVLRSAAYSRILVPLDHSEADQEAINNALALARMHDAKIILLHVEEGVTSQMFGSDSSTAEITEGQAYLESIEKALREQSVGVEVVVRHGNTPAHEIVSRRARPRARPLGHGLSRPQRHQRSRFRHHHQCRSPQNQSTHDDCQQILMHNGRILVTGGAGLIGSALIWELNRQGATNIIVADLLGKDEKWKNLTPLKFADYVEGDDLLERLESVQRHHDDLPHGRMFFHDGDGCGLSDSQ